MTKRALISVSNKEGVADFARQLQQLGFEILSTGGTKAVLAEQGVAVTPVGDATGFPEILGGRVKTLHPLIHGGLLADLDSAEHRAQLDANGISPIELVCVNLYPFREVIAATGTTEEEAIENIDIGGPAMLRASAKNHRHVTVVIDPADYAVVLAELAQGAVAPETRRRLAAKAFRHTAAYDAAIAGYMTDSAGEAFPEALTMAYELQQPLRYGENPHQAAAFYRAGGRAGDFSLARAEQLHGKELSYNNIQDANAALQALREFSSPAAVVVKHMNPCGVGAGASIAEALRKAREADETSIFGGIVALNREVDRPTAQQLAGIFLEIVLAPSFSPEALQALTAKKNVRLLAVPMAELGGAPRLHTVSIDGGLLVQSADALGYEDAQKTVVTKRQPTAEEWKALELGWSVVKHVKSNAIVVSGPSCTYGIGAGQMNRVGAAKIALAQAGDRARGAALASDAFFPMGDTVEAAARAGITAIIQPGGSVKDAESIEKADECGIAMVMTGVRHFKH